MFNPLSTKDSALQIALRLEGQDLSNLCEVNDQLQEWICNNGIFWNQKIKRDFNIDTYKVLEGGGTSDDYRFLYNSQGKDLNDLLIEESSLGNINHIKLLLEKGADIHAENDGALRWAAAYGHRDVVELLLEKGANIRAENDSALRRAAVNGYRDVVELLLKRGANPDVLN